ncbi:MAG TPA: VWA domain-containing protein [Thermoanaerobaculia bacterium]|nr:VWA domain-containing protein [Thermoanaerobaculia bacterium]
MRALRLTAALLLLLGLPGQAQETPAAAAEPAALPERFRTWLEEVSVLITEEERKAFLALAKDYQRQAFIDRFWRERDPYPDTGRNELRDHWEERVTIARTRFRNLGDLRSKVLLLNGPPTLWKPFNCRATIFAVELWVYQEGSDRYRQPFLLMFLKRGKTYSLWHPVEGFDSLVDFDKSAACNPQESRLFNSAVAWMRERADFTYLSIFDAVLEAPRPASREWVATFNTYTTDLPPAAETFPARLGLEFPGYYQNRTVVQAALAVPASVVAVGELGGHRSYNLLVTGEVLSGPDLFDSFRYKFDFPAGQVAGAELPLFFQRYLRPDSQYTLLVKVEDLNSGRFARIEQPLAVPRVASQEIPPPADPQVAEALAEANRALASGETTVQLVPPIGALLTGLVRFDTLVTGDGVAAVSFWLNDEPVFTKTKPPYSVELDLGSFPRVHTVRAKALGTLGEELASDELLVNIAGNRFRVRLVEPQRGRVYKKSVRARAEVEVPKGEAVERVELYLNDQLVSTLYQPPYVQPMILPEGEPLTYVRAVAYRPDGGFAEDLVLVNAPDYAEEVDIQLVELYTSVLDRRGRPVAGLGAADFRVTEDGKPQDVRRFEQVSDLPFHALILLDVSASMAPRLEPAKAAALGFFRQAVDRQDRAGIIVFNDRPYLAAPFTNELAAFGSGLAGLKAERGTALYDSLIYSLFYFSGIGGQRALILLSDGKDEASRFTFDQALEYVRRAGVTLFTVSVGVEKKEAEAKKGLARLAEETGGRSFFLASTEDLPATYAAIEQELRSQYLLAYQSKNLARTRGFRVVEVEVDRPGVEVKTLRGYYP